MIVFNFLPADFLHRLLQPFSHQSTGQTRYSRWWRKGGLVELLQTEFPEDLLSTNCDHLQRNILIILEARVLQDPSPPGKALHLLEKPCLVLAPQLLHQHFHALLSKPHLDNRRDYGTLLHIYIRVEFYYQDDVRAEILKELQKSAECFFFSYTNHPGNLLYQHRWPEEEGVLVLQVPGHVECLHQIATHFVVVQIHGQDRRDHWEEERGLMVSGNSCQLGEVGIGRGGRAKELEMAENELGGFRLISNLLALPFNNFSCIPGKYKMNHY